jgi:aspartokinase-like uncharacterized kinase
MKPVPVSVVKVGGSLFDLPDLPAALDRWLTRQPGAVYVLVGGGGPFAEQVRRDAGRFAISPEAAHWICVDLLTATARLLAEILPSAEWVRDYDRLLLTLSGSEMKCVVFAVRDFLERVEPGLPGAVLPHAWSVTSDSIAARLADALGAQELVLLKSIDAPARVDAASAAAAGLVDDFFPTAAKTLPAVRWVNLRDAAATETNLSVG